MTKGFCCFLLLLGGCRDCGEGAGCMSVASPNQNI